MEILGAVFKDYFGKRGRGNKIAKGLGINKKWIKNVIDHFSRSRWRGLAGTYATK